MKNVIVSLSLIVFSELVVAQGGGVVVPKDTVPFKVVEKEIIRLTGKGIAGSKIEIDIKGPAKVEATNSITERVQGAKPIGNSVKEFDLKPTGKGKVEITIKVTPPQPDAKPVETKYEFEVK